MTSFNATSQANDSLAKGTKKGDCQYLATMLVAVVGGLTIAASTPAFAEDRYYTAVGDTWWNDYFARGGFDTIAPGAGDRAIYGLAGTGQSVVANARGAGQLVFQAPYSGSGFVTGPLQGIFTIYGLNGLGVDSQVDHEITLTDKIALAGNQEWRIDSATGTISQLTNAASGRGINLDSYMLNLNAVNAGNHFDFSNPIYGTGGIAVSGAGTTFLRGINTYEGGTFFNGGTLSVSSDTNLGASSGGLTFNGGTLQTTTSFTSARAVALEANGGTFNTSPATILALTGGISGTGGVTKTGAGTLELGEQNSYSGQTVVTAGTLALTGTGGIAASERVVADGTFNISGTNAGATIQRLAGTGEVAVGGQTLTLANANDTFSGQFSGTGGLVLMTGQQMLTGDSSAFAGATTVRDGLLSVNGVLGGTMNVNGGRLQGIGTVGTTSHDAGATIAPGNSIGTLTINGDYIGKGGLVEIETVLGNDSSSTDLLNITGNTSGTANVKVINVGGVGAPTIEGIKIIDIGGTSDGVFSLKGDYLFEGDQAVVGGAYAYRLYQNGVSTPADGDWYLRSALEPVVPSITPPVTPAPVVPLYQPGVPLYESYANILQSFNALGTLQQRVGNRSWSGAGIDETGEPADGSIQGNGSWGRIEAAHGSFNPKTSTSGAQYDLDLWKLQLGVDGSLYDEEAGRLIVGLSGHYGTISSDIASIFGDGSIKSTGYGLGGTLTWYANSGFYLDGQAQVSWYDSELSSRTTGLDLKNDSDGFGYSLSIEGGQKIALGSNWSITPQAQLAYSEVSFDDFTDVFGASVALDRGNSLKGRLGTSADYQNEWRDEDGQISRSHVYGIANLYYDFLEGSRTDVAGVKFTSENDPLWGGIGIGGSYSWSDDKYSLFGETLVDTSLRDFGDSYALKGVAGLRVKF